MGIPAFYRWLAERYPKSVVQAAEETPVGFNGVKAPTDTSRPNPNATEFDNLYLDMNGIIHPCFHPEGLRAPETYDEVFKAVFKYIDRIFSIVRPRKLLYMAIDGVAPRAKMNQQRARRFRTAKDAADEACGAEGKRSGEGEYLGTQKLDSNVITPGTKFMELLSSALQYYIHLKINEDPGWRGIKVILSDASVAGEGEHKIMSYIRLQRNLPGSDPSTRHCLYGLDADLIMLALATHEVHFSVLREDIRKMPGKNESLKHKGDPSLMNKSRVDEKLDQGVDWGKDVEHVISKQKFQFLNIWMLRDYLAHDLRMPDPTLKLDSERLLDDFVFMCIFVGNDFLPHVPSLEISEGAIDLMMSVYKKEFVHMGGYLTNSFEVNLKRVEHFIQAVGSHENAIFRRRNQVQKEWERFQQHSINNVGGEEIQNKCKNSPNDVKLPADKVKLGEEGWKERYYNEKFEVWTNDDLEKTRSDAVMKYIEGICWVMHYYYQGVCSWQWYYPYHYAPFASDFHDLDRLDVRFTLGKPFKPFDQLMGVLPAASSQALPISYRKLMTDPLSPILDFYPADFELDINGKRHAWQAVCKLPFIEEDRLLSEIVNVENTLTDEEKQRNRLGLDILSIHRSHPLAGKIISFYKRNKDSPKLSKIKVKRKIDPNFSNGMNGYLYISDKLVCPLTIHSPVDGMEPIGNNQVVSVFYKLPCIHRHIPRPPEGVKMPEKSIGKRDILPPPILWHEKTALLRLSNRPSPPKSVSGPSLAKLAHQLVAESCHGKRQRNNKDSENGNIRKRKMDDRSCKVKFGKKRRSKKRGTEVQKRLS